MSTKIYIAWRCTAKAFPDFLSAFRSHCLAKIGKRVDYLAAGLKTQAIRDIYDDKGWEKELPFGDFLQKHEKRIRISQVFKLAAMASKSTLRDPMFCIDCCMNFWIQGKYIYIIPYAENWIYQDFALPQNVEDYCYWNNSDEPEGISYKQWKTRGKNWDSICDDWDAARNVHEIVNAGSGIGLVAIAKQFINEDQSYMALPHKEHDPEAFAKEKNERSTRLDSFVISYKGAMEAVK